MLIDGVRVDRQKRQSGVDGRGSLSEAACAIGALRGKRLGGVYRKRPSLRCLILFGRKALQSTPCFATSCSMEHTGDKVETKADGWIAAMCTMSAEVLWGAAAIHCGGAG